MVESRTFICESNKNNTIYYDIDDNGIIYNPESNEKINLVWREIEYIDDREGNQVVISLHNSTEVPIHYTTNEFPDFLKTICLKLSETRKNDFRPQKFILNLKYLIQLSIVVFLLVISLIISFTISKIIFFISLSLVIPLVIFFQRQPISLTIDNNSLKLLYLFSEQSINYKEILNIDFEVINNDYGSILSIAINLKDNKKITIKKIGDIIVFFIMLQILLNKNIEVS